MSSAQNTGRRHGDTLQNSTCRVYEGPLDLLLDLIRKQEIDIHNIPIAKITAQYLDYLHKLEELDIDVSAGFLYMAATLIHIKSKMLLPPDPLAGPEEQTTRAPNWCTGCWSTRNSRTRRNCCIKSSRSRRTSGRSRTLSLYDGEGTEGELVVSLVDLVKVFQQVLERRKEVPQIELQHETYTVAQMMGCCASN